MGDEELKPEYDLLAFRIAKRATLYLAAPILLFLGVAAYFGYEKISDFNSVIADAKKTRDDLKAELTTFRTERQELQDKITEQAARVTATDASLRQTLEAISTRDGTFRVDWGRTEERVNQTLARGQVEIAEVKGRVAAISEAVPVVTTRVNTVEAGLKNAALASELLKLEKDLNQQLTTLNTRVGDATAGVSDVKNRVDQTGTFVIREHGNDVVDKFDISVSIGVISGKNRIIRDVVIKDLAGKDILSPAKPTIALQDTIRFSYKDYDYRVVPNYVIEGVFAADYAVFGVYREHKSPQGQTLAARVAPAP